jgi:hypothetical protein
MYEFLHNLGQTRKYSRRVNVFRSTPNCGHWWARLAGFFRATRRHMQCSKLGSYLGLV